MSGMRAHMVLAMVAGFGAAAASAEPVWDVDFAPGGVTSDQFGGVNEFHVESVAGVPTLFVGGSFSAVGGMPASNVAGLTASGWSSLNGGVDSDVSGMTSHPVNGLSRVVIGGFQMLGTSAVMAWWDGSAWNPIGGGSPVFWTKGVGSFDSGNGPELFVSGGFLLPDGTGYVARWNGTSWQGAGDGLETVTDRFINHTDATGSAMYVVNGFFTTTWQSIARWDGSQWNSIGGGINGVGRDMCPVGDALYFAGSFSRAGGMLASNVARWQNDQWSPVGAGLNREVFALAVWDDGSGPALYAGGNFNASGTSPIPRLAVWRDNAWHPVAGGVAGGDIRALKVFDDDGAGPRPAALYVGGAFTSAGGKPVFALARLLPTPPAPCPGDANADQLVNAADLSVLLSQFGQSVPSGSGADLNADGAVNGADLSVLLGAFGQPC